ncbi:hypothetical protein [Nonomuraea recticatena]|uniref:Uncharacterized protein n=1 Tax=Nonomuraea recticatena TaxID=46178 RepID=A0ABP6FGB8_9ACTN
MHLVGERLILLTRSGSWRHDLRAASNPHADDRGRLVIRLMPEAEWYLLASTGRFSDGTLHSKIETHRADRVWVETLQPATGDASILM